MRKILYTVATDKNGNLIKAVDAEKGNLYYCPHCKTEFILRKSGKTGKGSKRAHFAHRNLTINCTPETALHYSFKTLLAEKLIYLIENNKKLDFSWQCEYCGLFHNGNLLKKVKQVKVEYNLTVCQPDIALLDEIGKVFAVIEIVVTHKPEEKVIKYYLDNKIILIQINLQSDIDIENLGKKISHPDRVTFCLNPKCKKCGNYMEKKFLTVIEGECYRCNKTMKVATIHSSNYSLSNLRPSEFSNEEIKIAQKEGVKLKTNYSRTMNSRYIANTCPNCNAFVGDHYIFVDYIAPAGYGDLPSKEIDIGYFCKKCDYSYD